MELEILNTKLESSLTAESYQKLVAQIEKDFVMTGISYDFNNLNPNELLVCLHEIMEQLLSKEYSTLLSLLYRIDIPESAINFNDTETAEAQLVNLIVRREFLKVQLREKYS